MISILFLCLPCQFHVKNVKGNPTSPLKKITKTRFYSKSIWKTEKIENLVLKFAYNKDIFYKCNSFK